MKFLRKKADCDSGDYSFERGTDHDPTELISHGRGEPRGQAVNHAEDSAKYHAN
jgi:hypothetical protein